MNAEELSIGELADAAGLSRRAIRFYVQQRLLPAPTGRGRGRHYDRSHVERLRQIAELQAAGHSLDAIRRILDGGGPVPAVSSADRSPAAVADEPIRRPRPRRTLSAQLWTRLRFAEGVELHFDAARFNPEVEQLLALREAVRGAFGLAGAAGDDGDRQDDGPSNGNHKEN